MRPLDAAFIRRLRAEIHADELALSDRTDDVRLFSVDEDPLPKERPSALALALDRVYSSLESILERIARSLEGGAPVGPDWHRALLRNASLKIDEVRPAILGPEASRAADSLRRFRHFLRHAYAVPLDWALVREVAMQWLNAESAITGDLEHFRKFLDQLAEGLDQDQQ